MGRQTGVYQDAKTGRWRVDRRFKDHRLHQSFDSYEEAERWLLTKLADLQRRTHFGERPRITFSEATLRYLAAPEQQAKASLETEGFLLESIVPYIGKLELDKIHDDALAPYIAARKLAGRSNKTINLALGIVRRILRLAAHKWRDGVSGKTYLASAPMITLCPLKGHQREPRHLMWSQQRKLLPLLPDHLGKMALFVLNTGVRDDVVCNLRWSWEIRHPDLPFSVFEVPAEHVKGGRYERSRQAVRYAVLNSVAQNIIEAERGRDQEFVFVYQHNRGRSDSKGTSRPAGYVPRPPRPILGGMLNTGWLKACKKAGLAGLRVHDLRHTVGMRLREVGVKENTIAEVLWHSGGGNVTRHYSAAQVRELREALELIKTEPAEGANKTLRTLADEARESKTKGKTEPTATKLHARARKRKRA
jgi:integrase